MNEQEPKGFKVVDKRGQPDEERGTGSTPLVQPAPPAGGAAAGGKEAAGPSPGEQPHPGIRPGERGGPTFLDLVGSLQFGALASLGMIQTADGKRSPVHLEAAKESIDMMAILQEKTKGNLTGEEAEALNEGLYHIRMAYVSAVNAAAGPGGKKT